MSSLLFTPSKAEGLDIDYALTGKITQFRLLQIFFNQKVTESRISAGREGLHFYRPEGWSVQQAESAGDDLGRDRYWKRQGYSFTFKAKVAMNRRKGSKKAVVNWEEQHNILAPEFWSRLPCRKERG